MQGNAQEAGRGWLSWYSEGMDGIRVQKNQPSPEAVEMRGENVVKSIKMLKNRG